MNDTCHMYLDLPTTQHLPYANLGWFLKCTVKAEHFAQVEDPSMAAGHGTGGFLHRT